LISHWKAERNAFASSSQGVVESGFFDWILELVDGQDLVRR
jgi:hypothetical protein